MKSTEVNKRGKEFFDVKFGDDKNVIYVKTRTGYEHMLVDYIDNHYGEQHKSVFKILPEEFFNENGIELFKKRMEREKKEFMLAQARMKKMYNR